MRKWSDSDISLLKKLWFNTSKEDLMRIFQGRTWKSLQRKSDRLKLKRYKRYRATNDPYLKIEPWIEGEMLSDGHISKSGQYCHTTKYGVYADFLREKFSSIDMTVTIYPHSYIDKRTNKKYSRCFVRTRSFFKEYRDRWYENKKKIVPDNLVVNDSLFLHWFLGDGTVNKIGYGFSLATMGFDPRDVNKLRNKLLEYGLDSSITKENNIYILKTKKNINKISNFLKNIDYPKCYAYKFGRLKIWLNKFRG